MDNRLMSDEEEEMDDTEEVLHGDVADEQAFEEFPELTTTEMELSNDPSVREANLLNLQAQEFLKELSVDYDNPGVHTVVDKLRATLSKMPEAAIQPSAHLSALQAFDLPIQFAQKLLNFSPPEAVEIAGDHASETMALPEACVDVTLTLASSCFYHKDHLNHRYHAKRALYLLTVAAALKKTATFRQQHWEYLHNNPRKPVLVVIPKVKGLKLPANFKLRLMTAISPDIFPAEKLKASKNNLRSAALSAEPSKNGSVKDDGDASLLPTPHYNASILEDMFPGTVTAALARASSRLPRFLDAVLLLKVWCRQQSPDNALRRILPALAADMGNKGLLAPAMTPFQILRAVLKCLADDRTLKPSYFMERGPESDTPPPPPPVNFKGSAEVVFVDPSGWVNIAAHTSRAALIQLQSAARRTAEVLDKMVSGEAAFEATLLLPFPPTTSYDYFWRICPPEGPHDQLLTSDLPFWRMQERRVQELVARALGDRVTGVTCFSRQLGGTPTLGLPSLQNRHIVVAAKLELAAASRAVDIGPSADSAESAPFRQFWGERSEMRRFQDGRICETVAWEVGPSQRHTIPDLIVSHVVARHMPGATCRGFASALDWALQTTKATPDDLINARRQADAALVKLGKQLRSLSKLALKVTALQPISAGVRHTSAFAFLPHPYAGGAGSTSGRVRRCMEPILALVQLEGSGKWPDNVEAFRKMKAALGVQLAEELFTGFGLQAQASEECVDVFVDGFAIRLYLHSQRDAAVAERDEGFARDFHMQQRQAAHHGSMLQLAAAHPSFRPAAQMASRWLSSQLMSNQLAQEALELLVASAYCPGNISPPPGSPLSGFAGFLRTLAEHPWKQRPLIVDPLQEMSIPQRQAAISSFSKAKQAGIAPSLAIVTPSDPASSQWTPVRPTAPVVQRLAALARKRLTCIQDAIWREGPDHCPSVFDPCLADFDAVILLRRDSVPAADLALQVPSKGGAASRQLPHLLTQAGFSGHEEDLIVPPSNTRALLRAIPSNVVEEWGSDGIAQELLVGFEPVHHYVGLLEARFGHLGLFFADYNGGEAIAVKWQSQAFLPQALNPETAHTAWPLQLDVDSGSAEPSAKRAKLGKKAGKIAGRVVPSMPRVVWEMKELGVGLVADLRLRCLPEP